MSEGASAEDPPVLSVHNNPRRRWFVLGVIGLGIVNGGIDNSAVNLAMPRLAAAFGVSADIILWIAAAFMVVGVGLALTWGSLGDAIGRRRVYLTGFLFFILGLVLLSLSQNVGHLIGGRVVQAIGQSMLVTNGFAIAVAVFPDRQRGLVIGLVGSFVGLGLAVGPIFAGFVLELLDWRALFYTRVPMGFLTFLAAWLVLPPDSPQGRRQPFDFAGAVTLFVALTALLIVINRGPQMGLGSPVILALGLATIGAGVAFGVVEMRAPMPVINFSLFRSKLLSIALTVHFLHFLALMFMIFVLPFYLLLGRGLIDSQVGFLLAIPQVIRLVAAPISGVLTDRLGSRTVATFGISVVVLGLVLLARLDASSSLSEIVLSLAISGLGGAIFDPANESAVLRSVAQRRLASATALIATARQVGFSIGIAIAGTLYAARLRIHELAISNGVVSNITDAIAQAYQEVILVALIIMIVTMGISLLRGTDAHAHKE